MRIIGVLLLCYLFPYVAVADWKEERDVIAAKVSELAELSIEELLNVKITTASRVEENAKEVPASVVVIGRKEIENYGYRTLAEILQSIPGMYGVEHYYREGVALGVRGFWSNVSNKHIMILVDGIPQHNAYMGTNALPDIAVPVEAIEKIEVVRGAMSVMYGSGAFFGVINIVTESPKNSTEKLAAVSAGSNDTKKVFARLADTTGELQYTLNLSHDKTRGIDASVEEMVSPSYWQTAKDSYVHSMRGTLENQETFLNGVLKYHHWSVLANYTESNQESAFYSPPLSRGTDNPRHTLKLGLIHEKQWSDTLTTQARLHYTDAATLYRARVIFRHGFNRPRLCRHG